MEAVFLVMFVFTLLTLLLVVTCSQGKVKIDDQGTHPSRTNHSLQQEPHPAEL